MVRPEEGLSCSPHRGGNSGIEAGSGSDYHDVAREPIGSSLFAGGTGYGYDCCCDYGYGYDC